MRPAAASTTSPNRILDTREDIGGHPGKVVPGQPLVLAVPQAAGATSVVLNLTAVDADGPGWVKAWPCGAPEPGTSSLNFTPGLIAANAVAVKLGTNASVCISTYAPVDLVADLAGWFTGTSDFVGTTPNRIVDTRATHDPLTAGVERRIPVAGTANIPGNAALVAVNLTVDSPPRPGWVVAYPCGQPTSSSTVNFNAGEIVANLTLVAVAGGAICVRSYDTTDLVVDTYGYSSGGGQLQVQSPQRLLDTRDAGTWPYGSALSGQKIAVRVAGTGKVPASADSALLTVTVADATGDGFVTVWPCDQALPNASTINTVAGQLRSNLAMVKLAADGTACLQVNSLHSTPLSLVVDAVGWTTGGPNRTSLPANPIPPTGGVTPPAAGLPISFGPLGGAGCGLANAAFCATFDAPQNGGTQTGDLDPEVWGVSRIGDIAKNNGVVASHNACAGGAATPPPGDVRICNGQLLESNNDSGLITAIDMYPKQPFDFTGRTGKVVFDVSNDSSGSHGAWPDFLITDEPVPGVIECISECNLGENGTPSAQNEIGFDMSATNESMNTWGITRFWQVKNGVMQGNAIDSTTYGSVTKGSRLAMNHVEVNISTTRIDVYATDAGSTKLVHIAGADIPGGLGFSTGLVWMNDVHYNASKAIEPCECGTLTDHTFAWDNLGFDGPKTYRDLGFDVPLAKSTGGTSPQGVTETEQGYATNGNRSFTVTGVNWKQGFNTAKVVLNTYATSAANVTVTLNGHTEHSVTKSIASFHASSRSFAFPSSDVVSGNNTITITSADKSLIVANTSLILVAAGPVP